MQYMMAHDILNDLYFCLLNLFYFIGNLAQILVVKVPFLDFFDQIVVLKVP